MKRRESSDLAGAFGRLRRCALAVSLPFVVTIGILVLSLLGVLDLDRRIVERDLLILNLLLYWAITAVALAIALNIGAAQRYLRSRIGPILMASVTLGLSLAVAEYVARGVVTRTRGFQLEYSRELHHKSPGNASLRDNTSASIHTNADGLRTAWTTATFRQKSRRVAVMGDSFVFGLGVDDEKTAPYVLERALRERLRSDDSGVLNAGVISYSPLLERSAFRKVVRAYQPTLTILVLDLGDIGDDYDYAADIVRGSDPQDPSFEVGAWTAGSRPALVKLAEPILAPLWVPSMVLRRLLNLPHRSTRYLDFEITIGGVVEKDRWFLLRHPLEETRPYFEKSLSYIEDLARDARTAGSDFVLVVAPRYFHWSSRECPNDWAKRPQSELGPYPYAYFDFFEEAERKVDFPIVSLLPAFRSTTQFPLVFDHDAHWNDAGNRFVAETLADLVIERGLITTVNPGVDP